MHESRKLVRVFAPTKDDRGIFMKLAPVMDVVSIFHASNVSVPLLISRGDTYVEKIEMEHY